MRLSTCILPIHPRSEALRQWRLAEDLGFHAAYTYDHLSWRTFRDGPWFDALLTLTQAAAVTSRIRLGTLVTTPNFRHPVTLAKEVMTLDDVSSGRVILGLGAGTDGFDAAVLGDAPLSPRRRADRFGEFVSLLDELLTTPALTRSGEWYQAFEARTIPGCVQRPRVPFGIAATGPRGLALTARYGQSWITTGDPTLAEDATPEQSRAAVADQVRRLEEACSAVGRDPRELERIFLTGFTPETEWRGSADAFVEFAAGYAALGITEIVVHAPIPGTEFELGEGVYEAIAARSAQVAGLSATIDGERPVRSGL